MRGLLGEAADSKGVIEADGLYKYVYHQTLQYIEKTNQQLRLINQQKRSRGETQLHPEYPLQTPKRIVDGVGELILGLKPALAESLPRRQAIVVDGLEGSQTNLALSKVLRGTGGFDLEDWPRPGKTWSEVRPAIQACLSWDSDSERESITSFFPAKKEIVTGLLYLRGRIEEIEDGEGWLVLGEDLQLSRSWLRQELRRSEIAQKIVVLDCPGASSLADWVEDLQLGPEQGQCLIAASSPAQEPELFSQALLKTLAAADPQVGLPVAAWVAQLQTTLAGTGITLHVWLSGAQGVIEILPGNRVASVFQDLEQLEPSDSIEGVTPVLDISQSLHAPESQPDLVLGSSKYSYLERLLMALIGPIAPTLLRKVSAQAPSPEQLVENLAIHLPPHQRLEFKKQAMSLLQASTQQPQTKSANSTTLKHQAIDPTFIRQCERELANLVGPIATFLVKKALKSHPQISLTELVKTLAADIPDSQKALKFQQRLGLE